MKANPDRGGIMRSPASITVLIVVACAALVFLVTALWENVVSPPPERADAVSGDTAIEAGVARIAAAFACTCGSCGNEPLEHCTCGTAVKTRGMIRAGLLSGRPDADIIRDVDREVGGLRR